jgi:hypothetical protein
MLTHPIRPILGGTLLKPASASVPVAIVQRASSIWTATLTTQLKITIQRMAKHQRHINRSKVCEPPSRPVVPSHAGMATGWPS